MAIIKPFRGIRPPKHLVEQIASRPYDVLSTEEAKAEAYGNEKSLYRIIKSEIEFDESVGDNDPIVYQKSNENFKKFLDKGWLVQDENECYYIYAQTMNDNTQYGIVMCNHIDDYISEKIKKHELTRRDKEQDRMLHVSTNNANIEPVFFTYPQNDSIDTLVAKIVKQAPEYDFITSDDIGHHFWIVDNNEDIDTITKTFENIPHLYIADGHHRSAAAALVGMDLARKNENHLGIEEYNYFMSVCFPDNQLKIMDYNRVIRDLNGLRTKDFLKQLENNFEIINRSSTIIYPIEKHNFSIYIDKMWYNLNAKDDILNDDHPIETLDVSIISKYILDEILHIKDLRSDNRIDFVGGIRGLEELQARVDSGEMSLAIALYPVSMDELLNVAESGNIMPPKTTWFEPKLRSGLIIHKLD